MTSKYNVLPLAGQDIARATEIKSKSAIEYATGIAKAGRKFGQLPGAAPSALTALSQVASSNPSLPSVLQQLSEAHMPNGLETVSQKQLKNVSGEIAERLGMTARQDETENLFGVTRKGSGLSGNKPR